jgi:imidazolonepropionase-like amidohydrolase
MAYGLSEEEAVRCITQTPAKIMGIDQEYGTIEEGKSATLFVSKGNALDMRTNQVTLIMVNGELMETDNFQMELYRKYKNKYDKQASE